MDAPPPYTPRDTLTTTRTPRIRHGPPEIVLHVITSTQRPHNKRAIAHRNDGGETDTRVVRYKWRTLFQRKRNIIVVILTVILAIVLALFLTFGKTPNKEDPACLDTALTPFNVGGSICNAYYSREGIWNGSDIAVLPIVDDRPNSFDEASLLWYFAQDFNNNIIRLRKTPNRFLYVEDYVAFDARNSTRLAVVNYGSSQHVFYFDRTNKVRQMVLDDDGWRQGPLNSMDIQASNSEDATLSVCLWNHATRGVIENNTITSEPNTSNVNKGLRLWFATLDIEFSQYSYINGEKTWTFDRHWPDANGRAGLACQSQVDVQYNLTYVFFLDSKNTMVSYWKDEIVEATNTSTHPAGEWRKGMRASYQRPWGCNLLKLLAVSNVTFIEPYPSTPIHIVDGSLTYQDASNISTTVAYNFTLAAENTTANLQTNTKYGRSSLYWLDYASPNTRWTIAPTEDDFLVLYQAEGNDITSITMQNFTTWGGEEKMYPARS